MVRLRGRGPEGERVVGSVPRGHWKTITLVAGITLDGIVAPFALEGAMDGEAFLYYVEHCLAPTLKRGQIVILDNLPVHRVAGVEEAIKAAGAKLLYLPKYSPELNPIEEAFSKIKALLRKAAERTVKGLLRRIGSILRSINKKECLNFFNHAGYAST
jgi:transposase